MKTRAILFAASLFFVAGPALATPTFPQTIQTTLNATAVPDCLVCHVGRTGRGTVNTGFGSAMRARGLQAYDESSLRSALKTMESDGVDSDGDGVIDVDALRMGKDPNPPRSAIDFNEEATPRYGCVGGQIAPGKAGGSTTATAIFASLIALLVLRRRRSA